MSIYDNAGVALIPSGTKASKLYSVLPANGDGDFNATRGSTATRVNKDGLIESVATNVPRLDYPLIDGVVQDCPALLLEPSRTNVAQRTEEFDNSYWTKTRAVVTANQAVSPDGSQTADKYRLDCTSNRSQISRVIYSVGTQYTTSLFVKYDSAKYFYIGNAGASAYRTVFDIENGTIISTGSSVDSSKIENYGNGWYRCSATFTAAYTTLYYKLSPNSNNATFTNTTDFSYIWGAQIEAGSYQTSYISWDGSGTTTRSADACNGSGTSADFNSAEGVLFAEMANLSNDGTEKRLGLQDSGTYETVRITYVPTANRITAVVYNGANQCVLNFDVPDTTDFNKIALKYKVNDFALWVNGFEVGTDTNGSTFDANQLDELAFDVNNGARVYAKTKQLMTFKTALNDSELETLVSWDSFNAMATGQLYTIE